MPFDEIMAGASVRYTMIGGVLYMSVKDLIKLICDPDPKNAMQHWERMSESQETELRTCCTEYTFSASSPATSPATRPSSPRSRPTPLPTAPLHQFARASRGPWRLRGVDMGGSDGGKGLNQVLIVLALQICRCI